MKHDWMKIVDVFLDPQETAVRIRRTHSWIVPFVVLGSVTILLNFSSLPLVLQVVHENLPAGLPEEQIEETLSRIAAYQRVGIFFSPLTLALKCWLLAGILFMSCLVADIPARMKELYCLTLHGSLIVLLGDITAHLVIRLRGRAVHSIQDLSPPLGLDLALTEMSRPVAALVNYFSLFTVWYIVMVSLTLAGLYGCSKRRAFLTSVPFWAFPLGMRMALVWMNPS